MNKETAIKIMVHHLSDALKLAYKRKWLQSEDLLGGEIQVTIENINNTGVELEPFVARVNFDGSVVLPWNGGDLYLYPHYITEFQEKVEKVYAMLRALTDFLDEKLVHEERELEEIKTHLQLVSRPEIVTPFAIDIHWG